MSVERTWTRSLSRRSFLIGTAGSLSAAAVLAACGSNVGGGGGGNTIKIFSSLPRTGSAKERTDTIVNAIEQAIDEAGGKAGNFTISYTDLDDATAAKGSWDAAKESENANRAVNDPDVMVYIGTFNSGAAKVSIPILNRANLVMISPANTYPGLTKPGKGEPNEPDIYRPTGKPNYTRVVPADDLQGSAGANWAKQLGVRRVYVLHDTDLYGQGVGPGLPGLGEKDRNRRQGVRGHRPVGR
jgi:branched-chain amino acid transport system substrate-binding protein